MHALALSIAFARPGADATWELLEAAPVRIECTTAAGAPWCRSTGLIAAKVDDVASSLENMGNQAEIFEAVSSMRSRGADPYHATLACPGLLSDRD